MYSQSLPNRRYHRRMSPRGFGPGFGVGGICKVAVVGTCTYLICKKLLHTGQNTVPLASQIDTGAMLQPPGTRYPYYQPQQNGPRQST